MNTRGESFVPISLQGVFYSEITGLLIGAVLKRTLCDGLVHGLSSLHTRVWIDALAIGIRDGYNAEPAEVGNGPINVLLSRPQTPWCCRANKRLSPSSQCALPGALNKTPDESTHRAFFLLATTGSDIPPHATRRAP